MQKSNEKKKLEAELPLHLSQTKENIIQSCLNRLYDEILDINESDLKDEKKLKN